MQQQQLKKKRVTKDFETRSACDLKKAGAYKYSLDPTTQPTCFSFKLHGEPMMYFQDLAEINTEWKYKTSRFKRLWMQLIEEGYEFSAHNSFFERCIYDNILVRRLGWPKIPPRLRRCTAAKAAACALPRNLAGAGEAMKLAVQKDKTGYIAVMATCKPTRVWKEWHKIKAQIASGESKRWNARRKKYVDENINDQEPPMFIEPLTHPKVFADLYAYNKIDTKAEELLDDALPDLTKKEQEIWFLNQELNWRGLRIDIPAVEKILAVMEVETEARKRDLDKLTMGLVAKPGALKSILEFLEIEGVKLPNLRAKTIDDELGGFNLTPDARELLKIRKELSKTSTKKYQAFMNRVNKDGRVRDILMYHAASTGRDGGSGIQPHNFPRGVIRVEKDHPYAAVENILECDAEMLKILYGSNLSLLFSSVLRNMIIPTKGHELFVADFAKIEVAVLWWLAGNERGLKILREGKDPYIYQAALNTGKSYEEIEQACKNEEQWALDARQLGKAQILGCGFGMGLDKFKITAWDMYRLELTEAQSGAAVLSYRNNNQKVPELWRGYEDVAISIVNKIHSKYTLGRCKFFLKNSFLCIQLPSGRCLRYKDPHMVMRETDWGPKETLQFWAVNSKTKKWGVERTWGGTLTENIVQAVARDLMMYASVRLDRAGYRFLLSVHDEALTEKPIGEGSLNEFTKLMTKRPKWADEKLPLEAKAWKGERYRK